MAELDLHKRGEPEVLTFGAAMMQELQNNSHKGDWADMPLGQGVHELFYHVAKLGLAAKEIGDHSEAVLEYAADVGNCAMFVADNYGALDTRNITVGHAESNHAPWRLKLPRTKARVRAFSESLLGEKVTPRTGNWTAGLQWVRRKLA